MRRLAHLALLTVLAPALANAAVNLTDPQGYLWDIDDLQWGDMVNGSADAFDNWPQLCVTTDLTLTGNCAVAETYDAAGVASTTEDNGREVVTATVVVSGLDVHRKIYVPDTGTLGFARYLNVITNNGVSSVSFKVRVGSTNGEYSDLGSDSGTQITGSSLGGTTIGPGTTWFTTDDTSTSSGDPSLMHLLASPGATVSTLDVRQNVGGQGTDGFDFEYGPLTLAPGETLIIGHAHSQQPNSASAISAAQSLSSLPPELLTGMSVTEIGQVVNFVPNAPPTADAGGPYSGDEGAPIALDGSASTDAAGVVTWEWDCEDDGTVDAVASSGTGDACTYANPGTYTLSLTVYDGQGLSDTATATVTVNDVPPSIDQVAVSPPTRAEGDTSSLSVTATAGPGDTISYSWDFGDGTSDVGASVNKVWLDDGPYSVVVTATDDDGSTDTFSLSVDVDNVAPTFDAGPATTALQDGVPWQFIPAITDPGTLDTFVFATSPAMPAAMTVDSTTGQLDWTPTLADLGTVSFDLTVTDDDGGADVLPITLTVTFVDSEPDGLPDTWETANNLDPTVDDSALDPDADGLSNLEEYTGGTDPNVFDGPAAPVQIAPIGGVEVAVGLPPLSWTNALDPQGDTLSYEVELYADSAMATLLASELSVPEDASGSTAWTPTAAPAENALGWWRVRAADNNVSGPWSPLESYFVNETNEAPDVVAQDSPLEGDVVSVTNPELIWIAGTDVDGDALSYDVQVWDETATTLITSVIGETGLSWTVDVTLVEDETYLWEVRAVDEHGLDGPWSVPQGFAINTSNAAPSDIAFVDPLDGDAIESQSPALVVSAATDPEGDAITYEFELDLVSTFDSADLLQGSAPGTGAVEEAWDLAVDSIVLDENVSWYARARAVDAIGAASAWDDIAFFVRGPNDAPTVPALVTPVDEFEAAVTKLSLSFSVNNSTDPEGDELTYEFVVARDDALTDVFDDADGVLEGAGGLAGETGWTSSVALTEGEFFWSARAVDAFGVASEWAEARSFTVRGEAGDDDDSAGDDDDATGDDDDSAGDDDDASGDDDDASGDDDDDDTRGCDCQSSVGGGDAPSALFALLLLLPLVRRRR